MGFDKIRAPLAGRTVLEWSLSVFDSLEFVDHIILVCPGGQQPEFAPMARPFGKLCGVVEGGLERPDSVLAGAKALDKLGWKGFVAVHDAARPLVLPGAVEDCLKAARSTGAAALAERVADTLHRTNGEAVVTGHVLRDNLWRVQTPQILPLEDLLGMAGGRGFTDEVSALLAIRKSAVLVENFSPNFKITVPADLLLAEAVLRSRHS